MSETRTMRQTTRRAAHSLHRCGGCGGRIAARDLYVDSRCANDEQVWTWREHALCFQLYDYWSLEWYVEADDWPSVCAEVLWEWWQKITAWVQGYPR